MKSMPNISLEYTIEDIHKIREYRYEKTKEMSMEEKIKYYNGLGKEAEIEIERRRKNKQYKGVV